jgi:hypothetical protein
MLVYTLCEHRAAFTERQKWLPQRRTKAKAAACAKAGRDQMKK